MTLESLYARSNAGDTESIHDLIGILSLEQHCYLILSKEAEDPKSKIAFLNESIRATKALDVLRRRLG